MKLQTHPVIARESVRFIAERDSLNASILGPDAAPGHARVRPVRQGGRARDDGQGGPEMHRHPPRHGARRASRRGPGGADRAARQGPDRRPARGGRDHGRARQPLAAPLGARGGGGAGQVGADRLRRSRTARRSRATAPSSRRSCCAPTIPGARAAVHDVEAFGPVSTIMPYRDLADAIALANRGMGSLALSLFTFDAAVAEEFVLGAGAYHGRMVILDRTSAKESTGHGSPLPVLVHGGPGRAGGGEEMGGIRGVTHYMQRTALQGSPAVLSSVVGQWLPGAPKPEGDVHPFRKRISELEIGYTLKTASRTVTPRGYRAFRRLHRRQFLRPHGRGSGQGEPDLRRPGRPRLSDPELRGRPVRRSRRRARCSPIPASRTCAS